MQNTRSLSRPVRLAYIYVKKALKYVFIIFNIKGGTDVEGTITNIRNNIKVKGYNLWLLIASAGIASVGLDVNSPAVIIGAMLISPLMSPILGIGLSIGTVDRDMLWHANRNFGIAVFISFATSFFYFFISPLGQPTAEMYARIEPTLLDVFVAFFGGVAGIVAGSRAEKTNALPGVAIATALMPPLCTSGFGLATGRMEFLFGAFYLFFLNAVFISISTYFVVRLLKFPRASYMDPEREKKIVRWMSVIVFIIVVPSMYLLYTVIVEIRLNRDIENFLRTAIDSEENEVLRHELLDYDSLQVLQAYVVGDYISPSIRDSLESLLPDFHLDDTKLRLVQVNVPKEERDLLASEISGNLLSFVQANSRVADSLNTRVRNLEERMTNFRNDSILFAELKEYLPKYFPDLTYFALANAVETDFSSRNIAVLPQGDTILTDYRDRDEPIILVDWKRNRRTRNYQERLTEAIRIKFQNDSLQVRRIDR